MRARGMKKGKRFVYYSLYAWGLPLTLTIITFTIDTFSNISDVYKPRMGIKNCWFSRTNSPGHIIFFMIPIGIQIITNLVLFIITAYHCNKVKNEIHRMQNTPDTKDKKRKLFNSDMAQFKMNVKLFIVMGVSWGLELLATAFNGLPELWYISDAFNALQGLLVFIIFVFKKPVWIAMKTKLGLKTTKSITTTTTNTTRTGGTSAVTGSTNTISDPYSVRYGKLTKNSSDSNKSTSNIHINKLSG